MKIVDLVKILLPAVHVQVLLEIAKLVEQADAVEFEVQVAGRLDVVARQDAQAAGINGQRVAQAVFRGKVGDADLAVVVDAAHRVQVLLQLLADALDLA